MATPATAEAEELATMAAAATLTVGAVAGGAEAMTASIDRRRNGGIDRRYSRGSGRGIDRRCSSSNRRVGSNKSRRKEEDLQ